MLPDTCSLVIGNALANTCARPFILLVYCLIADCSFPRRCSLHFKSSQIFQVFLVRSFSFLEGLIVGLLNPPCLLCIPLRLCRLAIQDCRKEKWSEVFIHYTILGWEKLGDFQKFQRFLKLWVWLSMVYGGEMLIWGQVTQSSVHRQDARTPMGLSRCFEYYKYWSSFATHLKIKNIFFVILEPSIFTNKPCQIL